MHAQLESGVVPSSPFSKWVPLCAALGCAVFLYLETFVLPCTPRAATGDQAAWLFDGVRMFDGQVMYRDFDHFTPPGTSALYWMLFRVFGVRAWIPQAMLIVLGSLLAWLSFCISRRLMRGASAFLPGFLFLALAFTGWLDATHHWYSTLAATAALAVLMERRTPRRLAWAGALWGVGTCFAQSLVLGVLGIAVYLVWEGRRLQESRMVLLKKESILLGSYIAPVAAFNSYFIGKAGWRHFFDNTVVFVAKYWHLEPSGQWSVYLGTKPPLRPWAIGWADVPGWLLIMVLLPLVYILLFVRYSREARLTPEVPWERLMLVNVTGLSMLMTVAFAATYNRLYTVSLPALILLVWFLNWPFKTERVLLYALWATVVVIAAAKPVIIQTRWRSSLALPTGRTALFSQPLNERMKWLLERTKPGDYFFGDEFAGLALRLRNPGPVDYVTPNGFTRPEQVSDLVRGLEEHQVRFVSCYEGLNEDETTDPPGDNLGALRKELQTHYRVAVTFANGDRIWERKP
jgi:hypothetical protein